MSRAVRKRRTASGALLPAQPRHSPSPPGPRRMSAQRKQSPPRSEGAIKARCNRAVRVQQEDASVAVPALEEDLPPRAEMRGFPLNNVCQCGLFTLLLVFSFMPLTTAVSFDLTELRNKVAKIKVNPRGNLWATGERNLHPNYMSCVCDSYSFTFFLFFKIKVRRH